jgi:SET domain-containing protein
MVSTSYLIEQAELRDAGRKGKGVFATAPIAAGTTVAGFGGRVAHRREFERLDEHDRTHSIQIDDDLFLVTARELEPADYTNHSCEPNAGLLGNVLVVAMRDIESGEEICFDYAMCDADDYDEFVCACGTPGCRGVITGADWMRPELQERYAGYFSAYIARRIAAAATPALRRQTR